MAGPGPPSPRHPPATDPLPTTVRAGRLLALGIALLAILLRLWRIDHGLPDFADEAIPFREALEMWGWSDGRADLNPDFFNYPSLSLYLHFALQKLWYGVGSLAGAYAAPGDYWLGLQTDPGGPVIAARLVGVVADAASVLIAWRLAERLRPGAGWVAGLAVACAATLIVTSREIYLDPVLAALSLLAVERLVAHQDEGGRGRLAAAVVAIGLAAGAKYNAGLLVIPLAWVLARRHGRRALWLAPALAAAALGVFLLTSPYVVLDFDAFSRDFAYERQHMAEGHLGTHGGRGLAYLSGIAVRHLGVPFLAALAAALATLPRRSSRDREITVWLALLPLLAAVALVRMTATRYLVPLVGPAAVLVAVAVRSGASRAARRRPRRPRLVTAALVAIVLGPLVVGGLRAAAAGADTTRAAARRWLEQRLGPQDLVMQEAYAADLRSEFEDIVVTGHPAFAAASAAARRRYFAAPRYRTIPIPFKASGGLRVELRTHDGRRRSLTAYEHGSAMNAIFYRPRLLNGIDYFVRSEGVAARYEADPARYPDQLAFYAWLARHAEEVVRFTDTALRPGPGITVYRLGAPARLAIAARDTLDGLWWARSAPAEFRRRADEMYAAPEMRSGGALRNARGLPAPWVVALRQAIAPHVMPFLMRRAHHLHAVARHEPARAAAVHILAIEPDHVPGALILARSAVALGRHDEALAVLVRVTAALRKRGRAAPELVFETGRVHALAGRTAEAREAFRRVLELVPGETDLARRAARYLADTGG